MEKKVNNISKIELKTPGINFGSCIGFGRISFQVTLK